MVNVPPIGARERYPAQPSPYDRDTSIKQRISEREDWNQTVGDVLLIGGAFHREYSKGKSNYKTAGVSHEQPRRRPVVPEESQKCTDQSDRVNWHARIAESDPRASNSCERDNRHATRQTIEPVDQIKSVREADQPQYCYRKRSWPEIQYMVGEQ